MNEHPISSIMATSIQKIKEMVDVNTIIGEPITTPDGTTLIPISKVSLGFASGGSDFSTKTSVSGSNPVLFGGGSGAGMTITPVCFIVVSNGFAKVLPMSQGQGGTVDKVVDSLPEIMDKINGYFSKNKNKE